ncbi:MAG: hypothetical protein WA867_10280 [Candidatus Acidiferrales bacterium]
MALSQFDKQVAASANKHLINSLILMILWLGSASCARAQDAQPKNTHESWTTITQTHIDNTTPSRTTESHTKSGNRSMDKQRLEVLGPDGRYQPDSDTEKEIIHVDATTTRTVVRTYGWDGNGQRYLVQVSEEEARSSAGGDVHIVRTTSSSDVNGNLQVMLREVADTKKTSPDAQETRTTVYRADGNGSFTPSLQTQELQKRNTDHSAEVKATTLRPDGNGNWELAEVTEKTIKQDGKNRTVEERVSRPDADGRLSEFSRTVGEETETATGERSNTVETYSTVVPGLAEDGRLHLNRRATTVQNKDSDTKTTEQWVAQPNPGNPSDGLQVQQKTKYTVQYAASVTQQTKTVQVRDTNGAFSVVSVETQKSDQAPAEQAPIAPSDKPR